MALKPRSEPAETLALKGLTFLVGQEDSLQRFLDLSGLGMEDLRARAGDSDLLAAVMDHILADDMLIQGFCAEERLKPEDIFRIRRALPGAAPE